MMWEGFIHTGNDYQMFQADQCKVLHIYLCHFFPQGYSSPEKYIATQGKDNKAHFPEHNELQLILIIIKELKLKL